MTTLTPPHEHSLFLLVYSEEERLRVISLAFLDRDRELKNELSTVEQAAKMLTAITQEYTSRDDDEGLVVHFSIRLVNVAFSAVKLALSGYYQQSMALSRDITETGFLVHYLTKVPSEMPIWRNATEKERKERFSPVKVRIALDRLDGSVDLNRAKVYAAASELGAHVSPRGFNLLRSDNVVMVGPFFEADYLRLCVRELFMRLCPVTHIISNYLVNLPDELKTFNRDFMQNFIEVARLHNILPSSEKEDISDQP